MLRVLCLVAGLLSAAAHAAPYVPDSEDQVLLRVAPSDNEAIARLRALRAAALETPGDSETAARFARGAIEHAREQADPRWYGYAERVLAFWDDAGEVPAAIRVLRATIAQYRHRFDRARAELDAVIAEQPGHPQARLTRAVIHSVQARYEQALRDCAALLRLGELLTATCMATPRSLSGAAETALEQLDRALTRASGDSGIRLWALTVAAEIAERLGREDAQQRYERAVQAEGAEHDLYLKLAFSDFLLRTGQPETVADVLSPFDDTTEARIRLLRARAAQGRTVDAAPLRSRLDAIRARGGVPGYREEAMLALHLEARPEAALWLARENWRLQREPADALLLLQAARAARRPEEAEPVRRWMRAHGVEDVRLEAQLDTLARQKEPAR